MARIARDPKNPFGMQPPTSNGRAVCGYGDPNADFHVVGDHPGVHGGIETGIPFTGTANADRLQRVLAAVGLMRSAPSTRPDLRRTFLSYVHPSPPRQDDRPTASEYADLDRFFDAELRAVNAHILLPVGQIATDRLLERFTTQFQKVPRSMDERHAREVRGRGFLVVPVKDPTNWSDNDESVLSEVLARLLASDYRQTKGVATLIG